MTDPIEPAIRLSWWAGDGEVTIGGTMAPAFLDFLDRVYGGYCECFVCNPLVKAREKVGHVCPRTGKGFIGPLREEDVGD